MTVCVVCSRIYTYSKRAGHTLTRCNSCLVNQRRFAVKDRAVALKGGACERCGYSGTASAFTFHHRDSSTKEFALSGNHARSWRSIAAELEKCDLLCLNCHAEVHAAMRG